MVFESSISAKGTVLIEGATRFHLKYFVEANVAYVDLIEDKFVFRQRNADAYGCSSNVITTHCPGDRKIDASLTRSTGA